MVWFMDSQGFEDQKVQFTMKQELLRKMFHLTVLLLVVAPYMVDISFIKVILFLSVIFSFFFEMYRWKNPDTWINFLTRAEERKGFANYPFTLLTWFLVSLPASIWYPYVVVTLSTIPTLLGDGMAAIVGRTYGKHKLPFSRKKTIEGALAGLISALLLGLLLIWLEQSSNLLLALIPAISFFILDFLEDLPPWLPDNMLSAFLSALILKSFFF